MDKAISLVHRRSIDERRSIFFMHACAFVDVAEDVQLRAYALHYFQQIFAADVAARNGVENTRRRAVRDEDVGSFWNEAVMERYRMPAVSVEGPVEEARSDGSAPESVAVDGDAAVFKIVNTGRDSGGDFFFGCAFEEEIMVAGDEDFMGERLSGEPCEEVVGFAGKAVIANIAGVDEDVAFRE